MKNVHDQLVTQMGFEPATFGLLVHCSTPDSLLQQKKKGKQNLVCAE